MKCKHISFLKIFFVYRHFHYFCVRCLVRKEFHCKLSPGKEKYKSPNSLLTPTHQTVTGRVVFIIVFIIVFKHLPQSLRRDIELFSYYIFISLPQDSKSLPQVSKLLPQDTKSFPQVRKLLPQDSKSFPQVSKSFSQDRKSLPQDINSFPQVRNSLPKDTNSFPQVSKSLPQDTKSCPQDTKSFPKVRNLDRGLRPGKNGNLFVKKKKNGLWRKKM